MEDLTSLAAIYRARNGYRPDRMFTPAFHFDVYMLTGKVLPRVGGGFLNCQWREPISVSADFSPENQTAMTIRWRRISHQGG
jgi:hypothetical protein